jgi:hypothetical protein
VPTPMIQESIFQAPMVEPIFPAPHNVHETPVIQEPEVPNVVNEEEGEGPLA